MRDKNMTEVEKNQRVIAQIKESTDFKQTKDQEIMHKSILKRLDKCQIHGDKIYAKNLQLINQKCRNCKKINDKYEQLKQEKTKGNTSASIKKTVINHNSNEPFPIHNYGASKGNFGDLLRNSIIQSDYFKTIKEFGYEQIIEEINQNVQNCELWVQGANSVPSTLFCCVYRLIGLNLSEKQVTKLCKFKNGSYIRVAGMLFIRYVSPPEQLL